jgi:hypothetical protein
MDPTDVKKDQQDTQNPTPTQPVGNVRKEEGPISDYVKVIEQAPILHPEVKEAGVEHVTHEEPEITTEHKIAGITESMPKPDLSSPQSVQVPMDAKKAEAEIKTDKNSENSKFWLATLVLKFFKKGPVK